MVDELFRRFGTGEIPVSVTFRDLPGATRRALADLLGADRMPLATSRLAVRKLVAALGLASVAELRDVVETLRGPLPDRRAAREAASAARHELWSWLGQSASGLESVALRRGWHPGWSARRWRGLGAVSRSTVGGWPWLSTCCAGFRGTG